MIRRSPITKIKMNNRLNYLARQNLGNKKVSSFIKSFSEITGEVLDLHCFLSLEETDQLSDSYTEMYELASKKLLPSFRITVPAENQGIVEGYLSDLGKKKEKQEAILITQNSELFGAVKVPFDILTKNPVGLVDLDGDSLRVTDIVLKQGFLLDLYEENLGGIPQMMFELVIWGLEWLNSLAGVERLDSGDP